MGGVDLRSFPFQKKVVDRPLMPAPGMAIRMIFPQ